MPSSISNGRPRVRLQWNSFANEAQNQYWIEKVSTSPRVNYNETVIVQMKLKTNIGLFKWHSQVSTSPRVDYNDVVVQMKLKTNIALKKCLSIYNIFHLMHVCLLITIQDMVQGVGMAVSQNVSLMWITTLLHADCCKECIYLRTVSLRRGVSISSPLHTSNL